jgi:hypothetical protein
VLDATIVNIALPTAQKALALDPAGEHPDRDRGGPGGGALRRREPGEGNTRYDLPGAVTATGGLVALVYGFTKASSDGWGAPITVGLLIAAAALLVSFVVIELRSSHPLLPMRVILDRNRGGAFLSALLIGVGMFGVFLFLTFYLQVTLDYSVLMTGVAFLPFAVGIIAGAGVSSQLQTRSGPGC